MAPPTTKQIAFIKDVLPVFFAILMATFAILNGHFQYFGPKRKVSGFWSPRVSPQTCLSAFLIFFFFAMKRCPVTAKIAGSIRILLCCVLNNFSHRGRGPMNIGPTCIKHLPDL